MKIEETYSIAKFQVTDMEQRLKRKVRLQIQ